MATVNGKAAVRTGDLGALRQIAVRGAGEAAHVDPRTRARLLRKLDTEMLATLLSDALARYTRAVSVLDDQAVSHHPGGIASLDESLGDVNAAARAVADLLLKNGGT